MSPTRRHGAAVAALVAATALLLPATPALAGAAERPGGGDSFPSYTVEVGDSLSTIARDHGVTTAELAAANGLADVHLIRIGQELDIPVRVPAVHTVGPGETLSGIARAYGVRWAELAALNAIDQPDRIRDGVQLRIPAAVTPAPAGGQVAPLATPGPGVAAPGPVPGYPSLPERIAATPERAALVPSFEHWAAHYGIPGDLLMAVAFQESGWQADVRSGKGAIGIGQLMPATASWVGGDLIGEPGLDPMVADDNIRMSARFLSWLIQTTGGIPEALAGYYQGPTSVAVNGRFVDTEQYVASVEAVRWRFERV